MTASSSKLRHLSLFFRNGKSREMKKKNILSSLGVRTILVLMTCSLSTQFLTAQNWYNTDWSYRIPVTITHPGTTSLTDYQVEISLDNTFNWADLNSDTTDIRFTGSDGVTPLDFWVEEWTHSTSALIWVKVPAIAAGTNTTIYFYYGNDNPSVTSASNGENTFAFFDGFNGEDLSEKWNIIIDNVASTSVANGLLTLTANRSGFTSSHVRIEGSTSFGTGYVGETRGKHPNQGSISLIAESGFVSASTWVHCIRIMDNHPAGESPNTEYWQKRTQTGGVAGPIKNMQQTADASFHIFRMYRNIGNTVDFEIDNTGKEEETENIPTVELYPFLMSYINASGINEFIVDWTRVRKWNEDAENLTTNLDPIQEQELTTWTGDSGTDWTATGNWSTSQVPGSTSYTLIPDVTNKPSISNISPAIQSLEIDPSSSLIIEPDGALTVDGALINNGTLNMDSDASGISSLIVGSRSGTGTENVELYITGGGTAPNYNWHYISSPVSGLSTSVFSGTTLNLAAFYEGRPTALTREGWVAFDGYVYSTGTMDGPTFNTLEVGRGYDLYHNVDHTFTLSGNLNTGDVTLENLSYSGTTEEWNGLNLIGNPYASSIDWSTIDDDLTNVGGAIYFTQAGSIVSWVDGGGTGGASPIIPPMQGFLVFATDANNSVNIETADRLHGSTARYKSGSMSPLLRLELSDQDEEGDETLIRFKNLATEDFDYSFDAFKLMVNESRNQIWSGINNEKYSINSIPFPEEETIIPIMVNIPETGQYTLKSTDISGLDNYNIILTDHAQGNYKVDLKQIPEYTFSAEKGVNDNRFTITFGSLTTGFEDIESDKSFNIYTSADQLYIQNMSDKWKNSRVDVNVYDLTGRLISKHLNNEMYKGETIQLPFNRPNGIYLIEITDGTRRTMQKLSNR